MIATQERVARQEIFQSIRTSIQELHADKVILEDGDGTPFLFKSRDAQVWARIFYRSMRDFSVEELQQEIKKLWKLMPNDAVLYLFYPELDREQIFKIQDFSDRLSFFEYASPGDAEREGLGVRICKWIPASVQILGPEPEEGVSSRIPSVSKSFLQGGRLTAQEIAGLTELSLALKRL